MNVEKLCHTFLHGEPLKILRGILHAKQSEMEMFETLGFCFLQFLFTAIAFPLNNNICLFVFFRMFSDNPVEIIGSHAFSTYSNLLV